MAYDKVVDSQKLDAVLGDIGNAIREKTGGVELIPVEDMAERISILYSIDTIRKLVEKNIEYIEVPEGITVIGYGVFMKNFHLKRVRLPDGLVKIDTDAFFHCTKLEDINLPDSIEEIGERAFMYSYKISNKELPKNLKTIGSYAFVECQYLTTLNIPSSVVKIGYRGFGSTQITEVTFEGTPQSLDATVFFNTGNLHTIRVPWSEGEVSNSPWGATNATIIYNYTGEDS